MNGYNECSSSSSSSPPPSCYRDVSFPHRNRVLSEFVYYTPALDSTASTRIVVFLTTDDSRTAELELKIDVIPVRVGGWVREIVQVVFFFTQTFPSAVCCYVCAFVCLPHTHPPGARPAVHHGQCLRDPDAC
jgi:hypothetical protein